MPADSEHTDGASPPPRARLRSWLVIYLKGAAMGAADTIPGVSGGTIALVVGIYERFVRALTALDPRVLGQVRSLHRPEGRREFLAALRRMDALFLVVLGLGVFTSVLTLSRVVHLALEGAPAPTFAFFFGLIAASAVVLYRQLAVRTAGQALAAVAGFGVAFYLSGISGGGGLGHGFPVIFLTGAIAVTAMVLPGISGAFLLLLFGQYRYLTGVLSEFVDAVLAGLTGAPFEGVLALGTVVVVFCSGALLGLFSVAALIRRALDRNRQATLAFLVSLMVGSLRLPVAEILVGVDRWTPAAAVTVGAATLLGVGAVLALDYYTADLSSVAA